MFYLLVFLVCSVASLILTKWVRDGAIARGLVTPPELDRHVHKGAVPRLGGVAAYLTVTVVLVFGVATSKWTGVGQAFSLREMAGLLVPATIVFLLGVYDDLRGADASVKFGVQAFAGVLLYFTGHGVQHFAFLRDAGALRMAIGLPLTVFWVLLITNAFNLIDGLDGLAAGSAFFSTMVMFVISLLRHNFVVSFIAIALAGAILGFLRFNFNPATIFLGDSGSLFIGFLLSALALAGSQKASTIVAVAIPVIGFGLPILDVVLAVARRLLGARPLFDGDDDHIHHKLLKRGLSHRGAVLVLYGVTASFGLLSVALLHGENLLALVLVAIGVGVVLGVRQLRYVEFSELNALLRAVFQKRIVANNVSVRRAAELLDSCKDREAFCRILQETLEPLGFSGFRLENFDGHGMPESSIRPLRYDARGRIQFCWAGESGVEPDWELRLQLTTRSGQQLGYLALFQVEEDRPQLFDLSVMTDGVRHSISDALHRAMPHSPEAKQMSAPGDSLPKQREGQDSEQLALRRATSSD